MSNCPVCGATTQLFDVVDFNKNCEEKNGKFLPLSGMPIYYAKCNTCLFIFAPEFATWTEKEFLQNIYNDQYIEIDPDYLELRPNANFKLITQTFSEYKKSIRHLDYGGGNGRLTELLVNGGWDSTTYDPFPENNTKLMTLGKFNLITVFEVFEHIPDVNQLMKNLIDLMSTECIILFSTLTSDGEIEKSPRLLWWYASPRNGHISLFSKKSLGLLSKKYELKFGSFNNALHCYFNQIPDWGRHLFKMNSLEYSKNAHNNETNKSSNDKDLSRRDFLTYLKQGDLLRSQGQYLEAILEYDKSIASNPANANAHNGKGIALRNLRKLNPSIESFNEALRINPTLTEAYINRANSFFEIDHLDFAFNDYQYAIDLNNNFPQAYIGQGNVLQKQGEYASALISYQSALSLDKNSWVTLSNIGVCLHALKEFQTALESLDQAIALKPNFADAHNNRGNVLKEMNQPEEAVGSYDLAIKFNPELAQAYVNRGVVLLDLKDFKKAMASIDQAIALKANVAQAYWNLSVAMLLNGDFENGFKGFEWRWKNELLSTFKNKRTFSKPLWLGDAPIVGKKILLYAEQGLGDTIQFCRYAKLVAAQGTYVILEVQKSLKELLKGLEGVDFLIAKGEDIPEFDYQCPLMSLPLAFKTVLNTIPHDKKYIPYEIKKHNRWEDFLRGTNTPRIGIVWSGNTKHENDANRSISLHKILPFLPDSLKFISLQKDVRESDRQALLTCSKILDVSREISDFRDTAALIQKLDLVISVDTSVAHLAGALGVKTWVLLPNTPDWRWLLDREDSPWYPSMTLYRQSCPGDWSGVLKKIKDDLLDQFS